MTEQATNDLSLDFLQELIDTPDPPKGTRTRKAKDTRDTDTWFKLDHILALCLDCGSHDIERGYEAQSENGNSLSFPSTCLSCKSENVRLTGYCSQGENCAGKLLYDKGPERVTAIVNDVEMCRIDFLDGLAKIEE